MFFVLTLMLFKWMKEQSRMTGDTEVTDIKKLTN